MSTPKQYDGGPAFPFGQVSELTGQPINGFFAPGMSLRDWFAGQALVGILSHPYGSGDPAENARAALMHADAMLAERRKGAK